MGVVESVRKIRVYKHTWELVATDSDTKHENYLKYKNEKGEEVWIWKPLTKNRNSLRGAILRETKIRRVVI